MKGYDGRGCTGDRTETAGRSSIYRAREKLSKFLTERFERRTEMIIVDRFTEDVRRLWETERDILGGMCLLRDDGFLPKDIFSPYEYFIARANGGIPVERELFFDFIEVPEFWEIRAERAQGAVYDMGRKKADIYFTEPVEKRNVQRVEWHMESGNTYRIDYYNKHGLQYSSAFLSADGKVQSKVYYSDRHQEVIVEQPQNDTVTLLCGGKMEAFFTSYGQFLSYWLELAAPEGGKHILWLQDRNPFAVWGLEAEKTEALDCVLFRYREALERYQAAGGKSGRMFYGIPEAYGRNLARGEALVLTASDQLEGIGHLIDALPDIKFHIAANTQVSEKLWNLNAKKNVTVYPQINSHNLKTLWKQCDFYLDINHYLEVFDAIAQAHKRNLVILGFEDTLHGRELTAEEGIFSAQNYEGMAHAMEELVGHPEAVEELLKRQQWKKRQAWEELRERLTMGGDRIHE